MGRRSRKRGGAGPAAPEPPPPRARDARPQAPWHPFPLVELSVLAGLVLLVLGFVNFDDDSGRVMLVCGMVLGSLGGLDTALREHFAGYRSHTTLLAAVPAVLVAGVLFFSRAPWAALLPAAAIAFGAAFVVLRAAFRRRSGGLSFR